VPEAIPPGPEFARLLQGADAIDLVRVNLEIAADAYLGLEPDSYLRRVEVLAERVAARCAPGAPGKAVLAQINWVLFVEEEFQGNQERYDDPRNSYLNEVLDRKLGIPISLSVLYRAVAGKVGLRLHGVNFPAHFLLRLDGPGEPLFIDPFNAGQVFGVEGCRERFRLMAGTAESLGVAELEPCRDAAIVARMLRNLKASYLRRGDLESALPVVRRLAVLCPEEPTERRDLGVVLLHTDRPGPAVEPLAAYLREAPDAPDAATVRGLLGQARRELAARN
jgi:regulator of sirC expression with transglutaminase-like and TPR domain